jgi:hypothetical protein
LKNGFFANFLFFQSNIAASQEIGDGYYVIMPTGLSLHQSSATTFRPANLSHLINGIKSWEKGAGKLWRKANKERRVLSCV